jgi:Methyltransferase domain
MLKETARRFRQEGIPQCELLRCDVTQLPIKNDTVDGVHAGAALHCWIQVDKALREVRMLSLTDTYDATVSLYCMQHAVYLTRDVDDDRTYEPERKALSYRY